jgi:hypothetical protein
VRRTHLQVHIVHSCSGKANNQVNRYVEQMQLASRVESLAVLPQAAKQQKSPAAAASLGMNSALDSLQR